MHTVLSQHGKYRPFVNFFTNVVAIIREAALITLFLIVSSFKSLDMEEYERDTVMWAAIGVVSLIVFISYVDIVLSVVKKIREYCEKRRNAKVEDATTNSFQKVKENMDEKLSAKT